MHRSFLRTTLVAIAAATLTATGLAGTADAATAPAAQAGLARPMLQSVGTASSGKTVTLKRTHRLKIVLPTAVDGGYRWVITKRPAHGIVSISKPKLTPYPHQPGAVGYPFHTTYVLTATGAGTTRIRLAERGPASPTQIAKRFTLRVHVPAPAPRATSAAHACTQTSSGSCIRGGEFCPQASYGNSGWDADGTRYVCTGDSTHPHWERP